jgi:hypothetical protein
LSKEILTQVSSATTAVEVWKEIQGMFASQMRAQTINTRLAMGNTRKGDMSAAEYFGEMKALSDEMKAASRPLDDELVEYIITGLDEEYTHWSLLYALGLSQFQSASYSRSFSTLRLELISSPVIIIALPTPWAEDVEAHVAEEEHTEEVDAVQT